MRSPVRKLSAPRSYYQSLYTGKHSDLRLPMYNCCLLLICTVRCTQTPVTPGCRDTLIFHGVPMWMNPYIIFSFHWHFCSSVYFLELRKIPSTSRYGRGICDSLLGTALGAWLPPNNQTRALSHELEGTIVSPVFKQTVTKRFLSNFFPVEKQDSEYKQCGREIVKVLIALTPHVPPGGRKHAGFCSRWNVPAFFFK